MKPKGAFSNSLVARTFHNQVPLCTLHTHLTCSIALKVRKALAPFVIAEVPSRGT